MHASAFDRFQVGNSPAHRLDPRLKVVVTLLFIFSNLLLPDGAWLAFGLAWLLVLGISTLAALGPWFPVPRSLIALPFALAALSTIFSLDGEPVFQLAIGPWNLVGTDIGLMRFASILVRSWLSVQMAVLLVAVTTFPDLLHALRHLHTPSIIVSVISFMYRYLFVLTDEALRLLRARQARAAHLPGHKSGGPLLWRAKVAGSMVGQLFLRSLERSERVYQAMLSRGYQGQLLTLTPHRLAVSDWMVGLVFVALLIGLQAVARF